MDENIAVLEIWDASTTSAAICIVLSGTTTVDNSVNQSCLINQIKSLL